MTEAKKTSGKGAIGWFRSGIRFSERLFKNLATQLGWLSRSLRQNWNSVHSWRVSKGYDISLEYVLNFIIALFYGFVVLPFILLWALLKSL